MLLPLHEEQETVQILGQPVSGELCLLALRHKDIAALHNLYNRNQRDEEGSLWEHTVLITEFSQLP